MGTFPKIRIVCRYQLLLFFLFACEFGCSPPSLYEPDASRETIGKDSEGLPVSTIQTSGPIEMDLLDIGEHPELEPSVDPLQDTPLYVLDETDPDTIQAATELDKVGVNKSVADQFPMLYQPCGTLTDSSHSAARTTFIQNQGYVIRCLPAHWDLAVFSATEGSTDYLVTVYVYVSEYCDDGPSNGFEEKWSFPKNNLNIPILLSRSPFSN